MMSTRQPVKVQFICKEKRERIYQSTLDILEKTGVKVGSDGNYLTDDLTLKYLRSNEHFRGFA